MNKTNMKVPKYGENIRFNIQYYGLLSLIIFKGLRVSLSTPDFHIYGRDLKEGCCYNFRFLKILECRCERHKDIQEGRNDENLSDKGLLFIGRPLFKFDFMIYSMLLVKTQLCCFLRRQLEEGFLSSRLRINPNIKNSYNLSHYVRQKSILSYFKKWLVNGVDLANIFGFKNDIYSLICPYHIHQMCQNQSIPSSFKQFLIVLYKHDNKKSIKAYNPHLNQVIIEMLQRLAFKMSFTYPCPRKLRQVMKISMIERESTTRIEEIWKEYHNPRISNTCAVLPKEHYQYFFNRAGAAPLFLLPVFRKSGHFKLITQWQKDCFLGTYLEDFKRRGSNAQPYVVFTFFTELLFHKGIVLVRGDIVNNSLSKPEAERLWEQLQASYCRQGNFELVHNFNNNTQFFNEKTYNQTYGIST